jgi:hypothetical protein
MLKPGAMCQSLGTSCTGHATFSLRITPSVTFIQRYRKASYAAASTSERITTPSGHFDACVAGFDGASGAATEWFVLHLISAG